MQLSVPNEISFDKEENLKIAMEIDKLFIACLTGDLEKTDELSNGNSKLNDLYTYEVAPMKEVNVTALMVASMEGHKEVAEILIDKGAEVTKANVTGSTALHLASQYGHDDVAKLLIEKGALEIVKKFPAFNDDMLDKGKTWRGSKITYRQLERFILGNLAGVDKPKLVSGLLRELTINDCQQSCKK